MPLAVASASGYAAEVCIDITAKVKAVDDQDGVIGGTVAVGSPVTGRYIYESTTPDTNSLPSAGDYQHNRTPYGITLKVGHPGNELVFRTDPNKVNFLVGILNNHGNPAKDQYVLVSYNNIFPASIPVNPRMGSANHHIWWQLDDDSGRALSSTALPRTPPDLTKWPTTLQSSFNISSYAFNSTFHIRSEVTEARICDTTPPAAPVGLIASVSLSVHQVSLSWSARTDNVPVSSYELERCTMGNAGCILSTLLTISAIPAAALAYADRNVARSTTYRYRVRARDGVGNYGQYSREVYIRTPQCRHTLLGRCLLPW